MIWVTDKQLNEIKNIIQNHVKAIESLFTASQISSPIIKSILKNAGIKDEEELNILERLHKYGKLEVLKNRDLKNLSISEIEQMIKETKLTVYQKKALDYIKLNTGNQIQALGNKISTDTVNLLLQVGMTQLQAVKEIIADAMETTKERYKVVQQLREMSNDWTRDWHRVAYTEMWNTKINGEAMEVLDSDLLSKEDTIVFKRPAPNACDKCKKLYLESDGKTPKTFKLSNMISFGTNYGKKSGEWQPVIGTVHPNCMCTFSVMPKNCKFNENGELVLKGT